MAILPFSLPFFFPLATFLLALSFPSLPSFPFPAPPPFLRSRIPLFQLGGLGSAVSSPQPKSILLHFSLKI